MDEKQFFKDFECPHCRKQSAFGTQGASLHLMGDHGVKQYGCLNPFCKGEILALTRAKLNTNFSRYFHEPLSLLWPQPAPRSITADAPVDIRETFDEAARCQAIGANRAAGAMYRATVEQICDEQGVPKEGSHPETGKTYQRKLVVRIDDLKVSEEERSDLHVARGVGNDAVHDGIAYTTAELDFLASLIEGVAFSLYQVPAEKERQKASRDVTRAAQKAVAAAPVQQALEPPSEA